MRHLLVLCLAIAASGATSIPKSEWNLFESLVPTSYFKVILKTEDLHDNPIFLHRVSFLALQSTKFFVQTLYARQNYLSRYVACSCPASSVKYEPVIPYLWGLKLGFDTPMEELVKVQAEGMELSKKMSHVVKMVTEACPLAGHCLHKVDDTFMDILLGKDDSIILETTWQSYLPHYYPKHFEPIHKAELMLPFQQKYLQFLDLFSTTSDNYLNYMSPSFMYDQHHLNHPYYQNFHKHFDLEFPNRYLHDYFYNHPLHMKYGVTNKLTRDNLFNFKEDYFHDLHSHYTPSRYFGLYDYPTYKPYNGRFHFYDELKAYDAYKKLHKYDFGHLPYESVPFSKILGGVWPEEELFKRSMEHLYNPFVSEDFAFKRRMEHLHHPFFAEDFFYRRPMEHLYNPFSAEYLSLNKPMEHLYNPFSAEYLSLKKPMEHLYNPFSAEYLPLKKPIENLSNTFSAEDLSLKRSVEHLPHPFRFIRSIDKSAPSQGTTTTSSS